MSSQPNSVRAIFDQVVDLPPTERAAALGRLCGDDTSLRAEVEALLASHDAAHAGNFMSSPTAATTVRNAVITEAPGSRVGPYKLLQVIGEGGFGTVFLAEQSEPVRRRVALKIIKLGMDTKQVIARFEAERQALALMDHPHIARVLDAGATPVTEHGGGRPYFVMEYVVGDAITQFAANNNLDIRARLELFAQVCSAVQHAHTKGIIHRDIKPGNVLVTMTDGKPFARVIDFGIAKATSSASGLTDKTLFTEHRQLIGTPEYMSPEQAQGSPDIDTRTDVYALGVLLYELLAGDTPFDGKRLRSAAWDEMRRIIKEEEPPTPSARVTQRMKMSGSPSSPSAPLPLRPSAPSDLRGELDWIVMKSLDKDRARRYETPSALAADVERHLKGEAVQAAPPSAAYRLRKFVKKHKVRSGIAAAIVLGIAGTTIGLAVAQYNAQVAIRNGKLAQAAREQLEAANAVLREQQAKAEIGIGKMLGIATDGVPRAPIAQYREDGTRMGEDDPLAFAIDNGIMVAHELYKTTNEAQWSAYTANLALAQAAMDAGNWPEARDRLAQCPESKRGWEWEFMRQCASRFVVQHVGSVAGAAIDIDDGLFVEEWSGLISRVPVSISGVPSGIYPLDTAMQVSTNESNLIDWSDSAETMGLSSLVPAAWRSFPGIIENPATLSADRRVLARFERSTNRMLLFDVADGTPLARLTDLEPYVARLSPDDLGGRLLVLCADTGEWNGRPRVDLIDINAATDLITVLANDPVDQLRLDAVAPLHDASREPVTTLTMPDLSRQFAADGRSLVCSARGSESNESYKELAVFRLPANIIHLQTTTDGLRLIIHLADGSARIWDIRNPDERRKDLVAEWAERIPAGAYLDTLLAGPTPTDALMDAVINDASLTPLRRLVAAEVLLEHMADIDRIAYTTFESIMRDAEKTTDAWKMVDTKAIKAHITAAASALEPSDDLPARAIEKIIAQANNWEYRPIAPSTEDRLADEERKRRLAEALALARSGDAGGSVEELNAWEAAMKDALAYCITVGGPEHPATLEVTRTFLWNGGSLDPKFEVSVLIAAQIELKQGRADIALGEAAAIWRSRTSRSFEPDPINLLVIAMASHSMRDWTNGGWWTRAEDLPGISGETESERARSALSRARAIMSDPSALDDAGRPWSENAEAQALLKEAEALIESEHATDDE